MIFSELYSAYYNAIAEILSCVVNGQTDEKSLQQAVVQHAFSESLLTIRPSLKSEKWQLLKKDMTTPIKNVPTMPLTTLEKRWLKAISLDKRIRLFDIEFSGLEDIDPLFTPYDYVVYDQYADGDPYYDEGYIKCFRTVLSAIREKQPLKIETVNRRGSLVSMLIMPERLEYSEKDDKFRLIGASSRRNGTINIARIVSCRKCPDARLAPCKEAAAKLKTVVFKVCDERNALERCMLHFAHFEKQAQRIDKKHYLVRVRYDEYDETEMVIRILGFGPLIEVVEPYGFRKLITERLIEQKSCGLF